MPSHERTRRFERDWKALTEADHARFAAAFRRFDADVSRGAFRPGLRVKRVAGTDAVFEMTWAPDGRATFQYEASPRTEAHVIWRRIGRHSVFRHP